MLEMELVGWFEDLEEMEAGSLLADLDNLCLDRDASDSDMANEKTSDYHSSKRADKASVQAQPEGGTVQMVQRC